MTDLVLPKPHLSASQIGSMDFCQRSYYYQSVLGIQSFGVGATMGKACHEVLEYMYRHRAETGEWPSLMEVNTRTVKTVTAAAEEITDWGTNNPKEMLRQAQMFIGLHYTHVRPKMNPKSVETEFVTDIDGIKMVGYIDLITNDTVWDHKFRFNTLPKNKYDVHDSLQLALYAHVTGKKKVGYIIHHLKTDPADPTKLIPTITVRSTSVKDKALRQMQHTVRTTARRINDNMVGGDFPRVFKNRCQGKKSGWKCEFYDRCWGSKQWVETQQMKRRLEQFLKPGPQKTDSEPQSAQLPDFLTSDVPTPPPVDLPF